MSDGLGGSERVGAMPTPLLNAPRWIDKTEHETCCVCGRPMRVMVYDRPEGGVCARERQKGKSDGKEEQGREG